MASLCSATATQVHGATHILDLRPSDQRGSEISSLTSFTKLPRRGQLVPLMVLGGTNLLIPCFLQIFLIADIHMPRASAASMMLKWKY